MIVVLTWDIVYIAAIHKQMPVLGVTERRQIRDVRCTRSDVTPDAACWMKMKSKKTNSKVEQHGKGRGKK